MVVVLQLRGRVAVDKKKEEAHSTNMHLLGVARGCLSLQFTYILISVVVLGQVGCHFISIQ